MNDQLTSKLQELFQSKENIEYSLVQNLWSNYGTLLRVNNLHQSYIVKVIKFPELSKHPRGWNSSISHNRKRSHILLRIAGMKNIIKNTNLTQRHWGSNLT